MADTRRRRRGPGAQEGAPVQDEATQAAMESFAKKIEERVDQQRAREPEDSRSRIAHLKEEQARLHEELQRQEEALRTRDKELTKELPEAESGATDWRNRLRKAISKTRDSWATGLGRVFGTTTWAG